MKEKPLKYCELNSTSLSEMNSLKKKQIPKWNENYIWCCSLGAGDLKKEIRNQRKQKIRFSSFLIQFFSKTLLDS